jgi:hypothetical protein
VVAIVNSWAHSNKHHILPDPIFTLHDRVLNDEEITDTHLRILRPRYNPAKRNPTWYQHPKKSIIRQVRFGVTRLVTRTLKMKQKRSNPSSCKWFWIWILGSGGGSQGFSGDQVRVDGDFGSGLLGSSTESGDSMNSFEQCLRLDVIFPTLQGIVEIDLVVAVCGD